MDDCQFQPNAVAEKREQLQPRAAYLWQRALEKWWVGVS